MANTTKKLATLTNLEEIAIRAALASSASNGHDFGIVSDVVEDLAKLGIAAKATGALLVSLQSKGLIRIHGAVNVNGGTRWASRVVQFTFEPEGFAAATHAEALEQNAKFDAILAETLNPRPSDFVIAQAEAEATGRPVAWDEGSEVCPDGVLRLTAAGAAEEVNAAHAEAILENWQREQAAAHATPELRAQAAAAAGPLPVAEDWVVLHDSGALVHYGANEALARTAAASAPGYVALTLSALVSAARSAAAQKPRPRVQTFEHFRADGRAVRVTVPENEPRESEPYHVRHARSLGGRRHVSDEARS